MPDAVMWRVLIL